MKPRDMLIKSVVLARLVSNNTRKKKRISTFYVSYNPINAERRTKPLNPQQHQVSISSQFIFLLK